MPIRPPFRNLILQTVHPAALPEDELAKDLRFEATRSTGPGGQHRNRVATAVRLYHLPSGLQAMGTERRSQLENKKNALFRLRLKLALEWRSPFRDEDFVPAADFRASETWRRRVRGSKVTASPTHLDFPALLAEVLDRLLVDEDDLEATAAAFRVSKTQLIRFLALEPQALGALNDRRKARGQRPLRA